MNNHLSYHNNSRSIRGVNIDKQARCVHQRGENDIIAIKFRCCNIYFSCFDCHETLTDHVPAIWTLQLFDQNAVFCGNCQTEFTVRTYMKSKFICPDCGHPFNPKMKYHYHLYFESLD